MLFLVPLLEQAPLTTQLFWKRAAVNNHRPPVRRRLRRESAVLISDEL